ncbi:MAG: asparagine synthase (glutamine-hydrolyzing) [Planctomycetes bacterium]|nr:asparagine synthase (glutamine-hydrolyzing) [Planctomycetota bacterium]
MCGIGGILRFDDEPVDRRRLEAMRSVLHCRGPDESNIAIDDRCGLVHTRLSILDIAGGHQPMSIDGLRVVFNGEIYNHRALRAELTDAGCHFKTDHSDTEVLLHGYRQWGESLPSRLRGMYAFVLWDGEEMLLVRDAVGKKPLYFWHDEHQLVFASTVGAVLAGVGRKLSVDPDALRQYLAFGYTEGFALSQGVREIGPMQWLRLSPRRADKPGPPPPARSEPADAAEMMALIADAVEARLEADVPLGCFLSGGIDSSIVAAIAQRKLAARGERLKTFSVSMPEAAYDEGPWAKKVADHIGAEHHALRAEPRVFEDLKYLIATMGEPLADSSILPTYWLSKAAREHVTVALSGDGGDELFGGYERYVAMRMLDKHAWWIGKGPRGLLGGEQKSRSARLRRLIDAARIGNEAARYFSMVRIFDDAQMSALGVRPMGSVPKDAMTPERDDFMDPADKARWWDFLHYLPGDLLRKVDRASMATGLEVRCPLLDRALAEAALATPMTTLMPGRRTKAMLRSMARPLLPADVCARKKMGFAVPIGTWFAKDLTPLLKRWLLENHGLRDMGLHRPMMETLIVDHQRGRIDHTHRLFSLLSLAIWKSWLDVQRF